MNDINEVIWEEDGKDTPGLWDGHWQVDNARKIKFLSGEKQLWQPLKYENDLYHCGPRERCIPSPAEQKVSIAEAYAFGAATSRNIEGRFLSALVKGEPEAQKAWTAIAQYNHFLVEHQELYHQTAPAARDRLALRGAAQPSGRRDPQAECLLRDQSARTPGQGSSPGPVQVLVMPADLPKPAAPL